VSGDAGPATTAGAAGTFPERVGRAAAGGDAGLFPPIASAFPELEDAVKMEVPRTAGRRVNSGHRIRLPIRAPIATRSAPAPAAIA
jgi:hypothetical protein